MSDTDIQRRLLHQTTEPSQTEQMAINNEIFVLNRKKVNGTNPLSVNRVQDTSIFRPTKCQRQTNTKFTRRNQSSQCPNFRKARQPYHKQNCIALGKKWNNFGILNDFVKTCRKPKQKN